MRPSYSINSLHSQNLKKIWSGHIFFCVDLAWNDPYAIGFHDAARLGDVQFARQRHGKANGLLVCVWVLYREGGGGGGGGGGGVIKHVVKKHTGKVMNLEYSGYSDLFFVVCVKASWTLD